MSQSTPSTKSKKAIIYARVSDRDQLKGLSLEVQKKLCARWAKENKYEVVGTYEDGGKTGTKVVGRDGLEDAIIQCQEVRAEALLVVDTDRIARNEFDHFYIRKELVKHGTQIIAINQPAIDDTPEGLLLDGMLASINAFYSRLTGKKVKKSLQRKCEMGDFPGWAPIGYLNVDRGTIDKPHKVVEIDPEKGPLITLLFKLYSTGNFSIDSLADELYEKGLRSKNGKKVVRSIIANILHNVFYLGKFEYKGIIHNGNHQPLTTPAIFRTCQRISKLHNQNACRRRKYRWLLNGFAYCSVCGRRIYAEWHQPKVKAYYHCNKNYGCREPYIEMNALEKEIEKEFKKLQLSQEFADRIVLKAKELVKSSRENIKEDKQAIRNAINQLEIKRNRLEDELLDKTISQEAFKRKHSELEAQINSLEEQIHEIETTERIDIDVISKVMDMTSNIYETYKNSNFDAKRIYLGIFFERFQIRNKKVAKSIPTPLFASLIEAGYCRVRSNLLPLKDLFCNHKLEFNFSLDDLKIAFETLHLQPAYA